MKVLNFGSLNLDYVYQVDSILIPGETQASTGRKIFCGGKGAGYAPVIGLIVENRNTCDDNSPTVPLTEKQIAELRACAVK